MKKIILTLASVSLIMIALASVNSKKEASELFEANIEALAQTEATVTCTFNIVKKKQSSNSLVCRGEGTLCCVMG